MERVFKSFRASVLGVFWDLFCSFFERKGKRAIDAISISAWQNEITILFSPDNFFPGPFDNHTAMVCMHD